MPNEGDGWNYVVDALGHGLEEALATPGLPRTSVRAPPRACSTSAATSCAPGHLLVGPHLEWASLLGAPDGRAAPGLDLGPADPAFAPEPLTAIDRQALLPRRPEPDPARRSAQLALDRRPLRMRCTRCSAREAEVARARSGS